MTPRERVLEAVAHRKTDRAPADFEAGASVWDALIAKLALADREELLVALGVDMRRIGAPYTQPDTGPDAEGYLRTMWGVRHLPEGDARRNRKPPYWIPPFTAESTVDDVLAHPWPDTKALDFSGVRAACERYGDRYALFGAPWSPFFHEIGWMIGQEEFLVWMTEKPEMVRAIVDRVVDYEVEATRMFLTAAGGLIDIAYFGNDFGAQRGLFLSPTMYDAFLRAPLRRFFDVSRSFGCRVMMHSCGSVRAIIPRLIEDGVDILDPVQVGAAGMDLEGLVRDFGGVLCFHGGVDTQRTLPHGSMEDVRAEVRAYRNLTREGGGYILCGSQIYIEDIPADNILALYEENARIG